MNKLIYLEILKYRSKIGNLYKTNLKLQKYIQI